MLLSWWFQVLQLSSSKMHQMHVVAQLQAQIKEQALELELARAHGEAAVAAVKQAQQAELKQLSRQAETAEAQAAIMASSARMAAEMEQLHIRKAASDIEHRNQLEAEAAEQRVRLATERLEVEKLRKEAEEEAQRLRQKLDSIPSISSPPVASSALTDRRVDSPSCGAAAHGVPLLPRTVDLDNLSAPIARLAELETMLQAHTLHRAQEIQARVRNRDEEMSALRATLELACSRFATQRGVPPSSISEIVEELPELSPVVGRYLKLNDAFEALH